MNSKRYAERSRLAPLPDTPEQGPFDEVAGYIVNKTGLFVVKALDNILHRVAAHYGIEERVPAVKPLDVI